MQDSALIQEISETLMLKVVDFLKRQEKKDPEKFSAFYRDFCSFIKEGVCTDYKNRRKIAHLLRYETTKLEKGTICSIDDYMERMPEEQKDIYFIVATNRETALASPYIEHLMEQGTEVLLAYAQIDQFVFDNLQTYRQKDLVSVEKSKIDVEKDQDTESLNAEQADQLCTWIKDQMPLKIKEVDITWRLKSHPAILVDHQSQAVRAYLRALNEAMELEPQKLQINPAHPIIRGLFHLREPEPETASKLCRQVVDNAFIGAGLMEDSREMLGNINEVLTLLVEKSCPEVLKPADKAKESAEAKDATTEMKESEI
jgi:HSP90 family molecular chaperone